MWNQETLLPGGGGWGLSSVLIGLKKSHLTSLVCSLSANSKECSVERVWGIYWNTPESILWRFLPQGKIKACYFNNKIYMQIRVQFFSYMGLFSSYFSLEIDWIVNFHDKKLRYAKEKDTWPGGSDAHISHQSAWFQSWFCSLFDLLAGLWEAVGNGSRSWMPPQLMGDLDWISGFQIQPWTLWEFWEWANKWMSSLSLLLRQMF